MKDYNAAYNCPMEVTLGLIGGKYKGLILWHLIDKTLRFSELSRLIPQATPKMLTQQLKDLEQDGLILRQAYPEVPPRVEYSLSDFGRTLTPVLDVMCGWGQDYMDQKKLTPCCASAKGGV